MIELIIIVVSAVLLFAITLWKRRSPSTLREIPALTRLLHTLGLSIEDGTRLHVSLGSGSLLDARGGSAFAGLAMLRHIAERTSVSDEPSVASAGDPALGLLTQDTLQAGYKAAGVNELYVPTTGRVTGLSPFGYAAGAMYISKNENVSANIMIGHFGPEAALLTEASDRENVVSIGASDELSGQAVLFANTNDALIGEELFATGAYLGAGPSHTASLTVQDIMRWLVIFALLGGAAAKFFWGDLMRIFTAVIAIAAGILVLGGYFFPALADIQTLLLNWAIILAGMAALVGIFNLISVHTDKVRRREKGSTYSAVLVIALLATFVFGLILRPEHDAMTVLMSGIIFPVEAALMGLLTVSLIYAAIRLLRRRADVMSTVFLITAAVMILGFATLPFGNIPLLGTLVRPWITQVLALGGARGILIGVALGTLTTGLRVLFGADRPYGGN